MTRNCVNENGMLLKTDQSKWPTGLIFHKRHTRLCTNLLVTYISVILTLTNNSNSSMSSVTTASDKDDLQYDHADNKSYPPTPVNNEELRLEFYKREPYNSGLHVWLVMWVRVTSKGPVVSLSKRLYSYCLELVGSRNGFERDII